MSNTKRLLITPGEPAGIGPDITLMIAEREYSSELVAVCDPDLLRTRAALLNRSITLEPIDLKKPPKPHLPGTLKYYPIPLNQPSIAGTPNAANAEYVLACLKTAATLCLNKEADALVTGPVNKHLINEGGIAFTGHTELLATLCGTTHPVMLFVTKETRVALATTHIPLSRVAETITQTHLLKTIRLMHHELQTVFGIKNPTITVCGLNPHAGEQGDIGREEIDIIEPVIKELQQEHFSIKGPLSADTVFTDKSLQTTDAILAMYHDQALPTIKHMSFGHAVNMTLGLPILRTSVDHGTAFDMAGTNHADPGSLMAAIDLAITLTRRKTE